MSGQWQLNLTSFGKLHSASIRAQKLTLLVGKNNTGKSYAATAMWSLDSIYSLIAKADLRTRRIAWLKKFFDQAMEGDEPAVLEISERRQAELISFLNKILERYAQEFYSEVFAVDAENFSGSNVSVSGFRSSGPIRVTYAAEDTEVPGRRSRFRYKNFTFTNSTGNGEIFQVTQRVVASLREPSDYLAQALLRFMLGPGMGGSVYIPAARNGLMLALPALGAYSLEGLSGDQDSAILPRTTRRFLQELDWGLRFMDDEPHEIADWLESSVLDGTVEAIKDVESPRFAYRPTGQNLQIPMHATSSMIAELAPVLICLRQNRFARQVIFEEPEAHLHLSAQRVMARAIGRLINEGVSVVVVTHSDTFVQQLNNLMALYKTEEGDDRRRSYVAADLINPETSVAYEFIGGPNGTVARELDRDEGGFIVPSLNETLIDLADETVGLQGA